MRIGHGYDVHRFGSDKKLILGGVEIPFDNGLIAHSDGDVVVHALCDSLLGAAGLRDIGFHFPDNKEEFKDISSLILLKRVYKMVKDKGFTLSNCDITIIAEKPKLAAFIPKMVKEIAKTLDEDEGIINIKATTEEGLGLAGNGIGCHAVCIICKE